MFLKRVVQVFKRHKVRYALAGGYAVALHGAVRGTVDIDLVVVLTQSNLSAAQTALESMGLRSRLPVDARDIHAFRKEFIKKRNLIAWSFCHPQNPAEIVDLIITCDLANLKPVSIRAMGLTLPVLSIADLIRMKEKSGRPQDREDVRALKAIENK